MPDLLAEHRGFRRCGSSGRRRGVRGFAAAALVAGFLPFCIPVSWADDSIALIDVQPAYELRDSFPTRVLFVDASSLKLRAQLPTNGVPCVTRGLAEGTFIVAYPTEDRKKCVVVEFDPTRRAVLSRYEHPRAPARMFAPGGYQRQFSLVQASAGRVWLVTEEFDKPDHSRHRLEAIEWADQKVGFQFDVPDEARNRLFPFSVGRGCLVFREGDNLQARTEAFFLKADGVRKDLDLGLQSKDVLGSVASSGGAFWGMTRSGRLFGVEVQAESGEAVARAAKPLWESGRETRGVFSLHIVGRNRLMAGLGNNTSSIDKIVFVDPAAGTVLSEKMLPEPAAGLACRGDLLYAVNTRRATITAYDFDLAVKTESEPLVVPKAVVLSGP